MATTRPDIQAAAAKLSGTAKMFAGKELRRLPEFLWEGEVVQMLAQGRYSGNQGLVVLTDRRLVFVDLGIARTRVEDFPFDRISSVQHSTTWLYGRITIFASGNKAEIDQVVPKEQATELAETLRARLTKASVQSSAPGPPDVMDQLKKLGELRDAGVVTPEEFELKKADLLKRL